MKPVLQRYNSLASPPSLPVFYLPPHLWLGASEEQGRKAQTNISYHIFIHPHSIDTITGHIYTESVTRI
ncbi:hypothetical protein GJAV_G00132430 [Gymnothorax javanicus]|nr:hypothetical protein GJAV_G00132430 [Gymnothorax javanicus]